LDSFAEFLLGNGQWLAGVSNGIPSRFSSFFSTNYGILKEFSAIGCRVESCAVWRSHDGGQWRQVLLYLQEFPPGGAKLDARAATVVAPHATESQL